MPCSFPFPMSFYSTYFFPLLWDDNLPHQGHPLAMCHDSIHYTGSLSFHLYATRLKIFHPGHFGVVKMMDLYSKLTDSSLAPHFYDQFPATGVF